MRIIAGERKGANLFTPKGDTTRPTLSRIRESLFSILYDSVPGARVLDLFAGCGSLGLEALSRGAETCDFVDRSGAALEALRRNVEKLRYEGRARVHRRDAAAYLRAPHPDGVLWDLVLCDPPYGDAHMAAILAALAGSPGVGPGTLVVLQSGVRDAVPESAGGLAMVRREDYGVTALRFYRPAAD